MSTAYCSKKYNVSLSTSIFLCQYVSGFCLSFIFKCDKELLVCFQPAL